MTRRSGRDAPSSMPEETEAGSRPLARGEIRRFTRPGDRMRESSMSEQQDRPRLARSHDRHHPHTDILPRLRAMGEDSDESDGAPTRVPAPAWAAMMGRLNAHAMYDLG